MRDFRTCGCTLRGERETDRRRGREVDKQEGERQKERERGRQTGERERGWRKKEIKRETDRQKEKREESNSFFTFSTSCLNDFTFVSSLYPFSLVLGIPQEDHRN
jgi:hypothetical protein